VLQSIELEAGAQFLGLGMDSIAEDDVPSKSILDKYIAGGRAWVLAKQAIPPVAFILVDIIDGCAHIEQVSVAPSSARMGFGRQLIEHVAGWARHRGLVALTLTTFVEVPWNGPYYLRCGFCYLEPAELSSGLVRIREIEATHGLDKWPRACMRRDL